MKARNILLTCLSVLCIAGCSPKEEEKGPEFEGPHQFYEGADHSETNHQDSPYFKYVDYYNLESNDEGLVMISHFQTMQQELSYSCGACSGFMVLNYLDPNDAKNYDELTVAQTMGSTGGGIGTSGKQIADFFIDKGYDVDYYCDHDKKFNGFDAFHQFAVEKLEQGHPIMVDWAIGGGHWTTLIGYDDMGTDVVNDDVLIFADSSDSYDHYFDGYTIFPALRFYSMWHETTPWDGVEIYRHQYVIVNPKK